MSFDTKILPAKLERFKQAFESGLFADALIGALNTGNGLMQQRIFTTNQDIEGNSFGKYVGTKRKAKLTTSKNKTTNKRLKSLAGKDLTAYERKRLAAGRQISRKDLEFTGGVRASIETVVENERTALLQFNNLDSALIAHGQENQITNIRNGGKGYTTGLGIKIFTLNTQEKEQVNEQLKLLISQIL